MAALLHRFDNVAGASVVFSLGGIAIVVGMVLLSLALYRSRAVPAWAAAGLVAGTLVEMAGFMAPSVGVLIVGSVVMLVPLCWIGWRVLADESPVRSFELAPSST
jgi:membrane-bound ClpP family serine protease